jgi:hypothetical protein
VTEQVHGAVGVPEMVPVEALTDRPAGSPVADQVNVETPTCESVAELDTGEMAAPVTLLWLPGVATATVLATVQVNVAEPEDPDPSVAVRVTEQVHGAVGVPEIVPVDELTDSPAGRPVADQVRVAPDWESVAEAPRGLTAVPVTALWLPGLATATVLDTVQENVAEPLAPLASVAVTVTEEVPGVVGVPEMVPLDELIESPVGRPVADQVRVAPDWESVAESVTGVMAVPVTEDLAPGLVTATVLETVQVKAAVPE